MTNVYSNADQVAGDLVAQAVTVADRVHGTVVVFGARLQAAVKRRQSEPRTAIRPGPGDGSEGPRALTGDFRRRTVRKTVRHIGDSTSTVSNDSPQAWRLELGFHGTDSAGRTFDAQPYPSFQPALNDIQGPFLAAVEEATVTA